MKDETTIITKTIIVHRVLAHLVGF